MITQGKTHSDTSCFVPRSKIYPKPGGLDLRGIPASRYHMKQLDLFWMEMNATHVWSDTQDIYHNRSTIYPLVKRPFHGRLMWGPRDPRKAIDEEYGAWVIDECTDGWFKYKMPCYALRDIYPFVQHIRGPGGAFCKEELIVKGKVVSTFRRSAENITVC